jgi:hypothetical protein
LHGGQRRILSYWLGEELGHDRLGRVYRAEPAHNQGTVIVRLLRVADVVAADRVEAARLALRQRLRAAAAVFHPSLVAVLDLSPHLDVEVLAVEEVRGASLADLARLGELLPADEALRHAIDISGAVAAAHARNITHGRITAANIRIGRDGRARLLDLGIPRPTDGAFHLAEHPAGDAAAVARRHDVLALGRVLQLMLTCTADAAALRQAASVPGVRGAALQAVARVLLGREPSAALLREALVDIARSTPAKAAEAEPALAVIPTSTSEPAVEQVAAPPAPAAAVPPALDVPRVFQPGKPRRRTARAAGGGRIQQSAGRLITRSSAQFAGSAILGALLVVSGIALIGRPQLPRVAASTPPDALASTEARALAAEDLATPAAEERAPEALASPEPVQTRGTLRVSVEQAGARVSLDGAPWRPAPVTFIDLPAERHELRISLPGFLLRSDTVTVAAGRTTRRTYVLAPER